MPLYEPPPRRPIGHLVYFGLAAIAALGVQLLAGYVYLVWFVVVAPDRPEDRAALDIVRAALGVVWVALGTVFLIGCYFRQPWALLLPLVALAAVWFGIQIIPGHAGIGQ